MSTDSLDEILLQSFFDGRNVERGHKSKMTHEQAKAAIHQWSAKQTEAVLIRLWEQCEFFLPDTHPPSKYVVEAVKTDLIQQAIKELQ